jgi:hypothetical protein
MHGCLVITITHDDIVVLRGAARDHPPNSARQVVIDVPEWRCELGNLTWTVRQSVRPIRIPRSWPTRARLSAVRTHIAAMRYPDLPVLPAVRVRRGADW